MASTVTRRLANSISCVVLSSSTSGQLTIPLVDPDTGKTVHYALVQVDTPPAVASLGLSPRLHLRTVSESGHPQSAAPESQTARRLDRLAKECMLDVSQDALRILEQDTTWPSLASSSRPSHVRSSTALTAPCASSSGPVFDRRPASYAATPSLYNESRSDESVSYVGTPISRSRPRRQDTVTALGSGGTANSSMLVGLGITGMSKEDGSPFDGLGSLERAGLLTRTADSPLPSPPAYAPSWSFLPAFSPAAFAHDAPEDPVAAFWRTATAADFRRYLDDSVSDSAHARTAPAGACGSWKVAKKAAAGATLAPPPSRGHKKRFSMPKAAEDLFMCEPPALLSRSERIMSHLEVSKLEEESWMKVEASHFLSDGVSRRPVSCIL